MDWIKVTIIVNFSGNTITWTETKADVYLFFFFFFAPLVVLAYRQPALVIGAYDDTALIISSFARIMHQMTS
jgi:hypothetical protein